MEWFKLRNYSWWRPLRAALKREFAHLDAVGLVLRESPRGPNSLTYGETPCLSVLHVLRTTGLGPGCRFVDLGSGQGVPCLTAAALGYPATGLEFFAEYIPGCQKIADELGLPARFQQADIMEADWPEADLFWLTSSAFTQSFRQRLAARLEQLPPGTLVVTQDWILDPPFSLERIQVLPVSWGMARFCYQRLNE